MPTLLDDGSTVTLDLHGARVDEAEWLSERAVSEAARLGRRTVRLIHGASTTERDGHNRTIKTALHTLLDTGGFSPHVGSSFRAEGHLILGLASTGTSSRQRLQLQDLN